MLFEELGLGAPLLRAVATEGYTTPHTHPDSRHPADCGRPRPIRLRPDGHRKDGRLCAAHPAPPVGRQRLAAQPQPPSASIDPFTDSRVGRADWRKLCRLWPIHGSASHGCLRRRRPAAAGSGTAARGRYPRCHARTTPRPHATRVRPPGPDRDVRAGRSRPDARHGLPARSAADHCEVAGGKAEPAVFGHDARADRAIGQDHSPQSRQRPHCPGQSYDRVESSSRSSSCPANRSRRCWSAI